MSEPHRKVVLVTGASSGIGRACADHLQARGHRVYGASRRRPGSAAFEPLAMDVDDDASVETAVRNLLAREGRLDAVVNNAGFGIAGSIEDTSIAEAKAQLETNFFGVLRVTRAVLPTLRAQRSGRIINMSSLGGVFGMPYSGLYSASKFAVEGLSEALRLEVRPFGVHVTLVEPGDVRSEFTAVRRTTSTALTSAHAEGFRRAMQAAEKDERRAPDPLVVALLVERILRARAPRLRYTVGMQSQRIVVLLKRLLPARLFEWALAGAFQIR
jgi:short-subunit dehydrogenase